MEAENKTVFICTKSDCIKLYSDYLTLVKEIRQDIESLHDKAEKLQQAAERLTKAHPTDMVKTDTWPKLKQAIKHTSSAAKQVTQSISIAQQAVHTADTTAHEIEHAVTSTSQKMLFCGKCKMKKEHTTDNIEQLFGYMKNGKMYRNCIKCRLANQSYNHQKRNRPTKDDQTTCATCLKVKPVSEFAENGKQFKCCADCRNKPKQKILALKEQLSGGKTITCCVCKVEQELSNYIHIKHSNKVCTTCNACRKQHHENFKVERQARLARLAQQTNNDDSE